MSTLNGLAGAGALMPARVVAPTLARPSLTCERALRGARSSARAPRPISAGTVVRSISASPSSLACPGSGLAVQGTAGRGATTGPGAGAHQTAGVATAGDPAPRP